MSEVRVAVFARAPVPGEVKTRLAALLGPDGAAALHAGLVRRSLAIAAEARVGPVELWCTPDEKHPFFQRCAEVSGASLHRQVGADLGERMHAAFVLATPRLVIGSDCPSLEIGDLQEAARSLARHAVVLSPAEDGGYVLIGLAKPVASLFQGVAWGSAAVMGQTRARVAQAGLRCKELATRWDVDRPEDYLRLQREGRLEDVMS